MDLNTQIWGTQNEWSLDTDTFSETNSPYPAYTGKCKYLKDYRDNNIFDFGTEIDNTILYCGQAAGVSPLGGAAAFYYNDNFEGTPEPYIQRNETVSTFLASIGDGQTQHTSTAASIAASALTSILYYKGAVQGADNTRWVIDGGEYITGGDDWYNVADMVAPIVDFDPKCLFGVIYVVAGNENDGISTMTLHQLETGNYSNYKIYKAFMRAATVDTVSGSSPYTTEFAETYSTALTPNKKGLGIINYTPWKIEDKDYVNYIQNGKSISAYPSIPLFGFDLAVVNLYHYNKFGFSWRSYHWVSNGAERDWAADFSQAPIFYGATYATFTDVYALKDTNYTDVSFIGYMDNTAENRENLRKMAACYGIYFTDYNSADDSTLFSNDNRYTNEHMCLGLLRDGVGYGDYTHGAGNTDNPAYNWSSSHQSGYDPSAGHDPNTYSTQTTFNYVGAVASTTKQYVLNDVGVSALTSELWTCIADILTNPDNLDNLDNYCYENFLTNNPIDCLVSLKKFPVNTVPHGADPVNLKLGKYNASTAGYPLSGSQYEYLFEPIDIFARYGNSFLDYKPYTEMQLYVPFCGTIDIDPADFMDRRLTVRMVIDYITGACTAYVQSGGLVIQTLTGTCSIDIPITGIEQAQLSSTIESTAISALQARSGSIMTSPAGFWTHPLKNIMNYSEWKNQVVNARLTQGQTEYELTHIQTPLKIIGGASPLNMWAIEFQIRLIIYYPDGEIITFSGNNEPSFDTNKLQSFGELNGFSCLKFGKVSDFSGFTMGNIKLDGIPCTESERARLKQLFSTGVYL